MEEITGINAIEMAKAVTKMGGDFTISFYPFSQKKPLNGEAELKTMEHCTCRKQLPHEKWSIDGKHYFLFCDQDDKPKTCYRALIRYIAFSNDDYKLKKVKWYE